MSKPSIILSLYPLIHVNLSLDIFLLKQAPLPLMPRKPLLLILERIHPDLKLRLGRRFTVAECFSKFSWKEKQLSKAEVLICSINTPITRSLLGRMPALRTIATYSVGTDHIDLEECARRKIKVINTPGVVTEATAELALALSLAVSRRIPEGDGLCRRGGFNGWKPDLLIGRELFGMNAVLVGKGRIGKRAANLFGCFGVKTRFITRQTRESEIISLLRSADLVSLHLPYTTSNHHWLSRRRIAFLKRNCIFINTSRGPLVDETALISALRKRRIFGAGLDVYEHEPKIPQGLRKLDNVVLMPHAGTSTEQTRLKMADLLINGILSLESRMKVRK